MKDRFEAVAVVPEPDESVLKGPVLNSTPPSTVVDSASPSIPNISAPRSAEGGSRFLPYSPMDVVSAEEQSSGWNTLELDGQDTILRPTTELDGTEVQESNDRIYELPGSSVAEKEK